MKIAILTNKIVADLATLKAIASSGLSAGDIKFISPEIYTYYPNSLEGEKPDDIDSGDPGRWVKKDKTKQVLYVVADNYDFETNNATNISSIENFDRYWSILGEIVTQTRLDISVLVATKTFALCTDTEKLIASKWFVVDKADRDTTTADQVADAQKFCASLISQSDSTFLDAEGLLISNSDVTSIDIIVSNTSTSIPYGVHIHNQGSPSSSWTIQHDMNRLPSVEVIDSADDVVYGDVKHINSNNLTVTFGAAFTGKAYLT